MELRELRQTIPANTPTTIPMVCRSFRVMEYQTPFTLEVARGRRFGSKFTNAKGGDRGRTRDGELPVNAFRITSTVQQEIVILCSDGDIDRDSADLDVSDRAAREIGVAGIKAADAISVPGAAAVDIDSGAPVLIVAANANNKEIFLQADAANSGTIAIGGATVVAGGGISLAAGEKMAIGPYSARVAWYAIGSADNQNLRVVVTADA